MLVRKRCLSSYRFILIIIAIIVHSPGSICNNNNADLAITSSSSSVNFLQVPNFCNDCSRNSCLNGGKCRSDDGRCDCQRGFWGNRCQYKSHDMYKFGSCPTKETLGSSAADWPQLQPDGCRVDSDCPGLWKCCPSFVATGDEGDNNNDDNNNHAPIGANSCTQPWLDASLITQLPLCLQHLWNITDAGRTFSGCDVLMCDESSGGRAFDRWQCNYCEAASTTCFCFISFDNEGKYWGELPGSRQKLDVFGEKTTDRPGVIHAKPKHDCSLQDRCPQMFPHSIYCTHGIQRDRSGCPTGDCLSIPEDKCFTPCSAGFLCEHRPEPEQVNQWHCVDTFRQFRVAVPISSRLAFALRNELENVSAKAAELVALNAVVDESIYALLSNASILPCSSNSQRSATLRATTAANAYLLPLQEDSQITVIEIVGQVAFSANFSGVLVRRQLKEWINETYGPMLSTIAVTKARTNHDVTLSVAAIAIITALCIVALLATGVGIPLVVYRRRIFETNKFTFTSHGRSNVQAVNVISTGLAAGRDIFSSFTNRGHQITINMSPSSSSSSEQSSSHQMNSVNKTAAIIATKSRQAAQPPTSVTPLPQEMSSSTCSSGEDDCISPANNHHHRQIKQADNSESYQVF